MARAVLHDHHDFDNGGPIRAIPPHDHTTPVSGGLLPPPDDSPPPSGECCPPDPPFTQVCTSTATLVQAAPRSNGVATFPANVTIGNTAILFTAYGTVSATTPPANWIGEVWTLITDQIVPNTIHLGAGSHGAAWYKVITIADTQDFGSHISFPATINYSYGFAGAGNGTDSVLEIEGTPTPTGSVATGISVSPAIAYTNTALGLVCFFNTGDDPTGQTFSGYTVQAEGYNAPIGLWVASTTTAGSSFPTITMPNNDWGAIAVTLGTTTCTIPNPGQTIYPETGAGSGFADPQQTNFDYRAGSIHVFLSGVHIVVTETDPATGLWDWPAGIVPEVDEEWVVYYTTQFGMQTVATNGIASPSALILRPADAVIEETTFGLTADVGSDVTALARGDHTHGTPADPTLSAPTSFMHLLTVYDGTNWLPLVDGSGNALYTFA